LFHTLALVLLVASFCMSGCSSEKVGVQNSSETVVVGRSEFDPVSFDIPYWHNSALYAASATKRESVKIAEIDTSLLPPVITFDTFKMSPQRTFIAWYTPGKGIYALETEEMSEPTLVYQPGSWFQVNAYFSFHPQEDLLFVMSDEGRALTSVNLRTAEEISIPIPFPYGTVFQISPEATYVVFISGFRQTEGKPTYLVTTLSGELIEQFETEAALADRFDLVFADNTTFYVPGNNTLVEATIEETRVQLRQIEEKGKEIGKVILSGSEILMATGEGITSLNRDALTLSDTVPMAAFDGLGRFDIYPYDSKYFLAIEYFRNNDKRFDRMWLIDRRGSKQILIPSLNESVVVDVPQDLE
jgi:hypothetical protein